MTYRDRIVAQDNAPFRYIDPPFNLNHGDIAKYPPEITGYYLLESLRRRLGWTSFEGRRLLDFGCGVRFARTIHNLNLPFALYAGVDVNAEFIDWLKNNVQEPRFKFAQMIAQNALYSPNVPRNANADALAVLGMTGCEAACMFSVITHQSPDEATLTFEQLRRVIPDGGQLYFTAFIQDDIAEYGEMVPKPGVISAYNLNFLGELVESRKWRVLSIHPKDGIQQTVFVCRAV